MSLSAKTVVISGGSRGIGEAIGIRVAREGANVVLLAKTAVAHPKLPGTIYTAAAAIERAGGRALALVGDVRDDQFVESSVAKAAEVFGGIDVVVNNASAIDLTSTETISMKKYDLMNEVNARGSFLLSKTCIPWLKRSDNAHILTLSPPISLDPKWFKTHTAYTIAKYGMTLVTIGLAEELRADGIAVNSLWPRTAIDTAAVRNIVGADLQKHARTPEIMADAAYHIVVADSATRSGECLLDEDVLREAGVSDFSAYLNGGAEADLTIDMWVEPPAGHNPSHQLR